jgi:tripartite-type tricarboxylate transporter receptor subunit TctC
MKWIKALAAVLFGLVVLQGDAAAQDYPDKPITLVVPFAAGGPTDTIARIVGEHMAQTLGQPLVVENVTGAGGTTGTARVAKAANDGYTIMMGHMGTHGAAPGLYPELAYNPQSDFEPIGLAAGTPIVIVAKQDFAAASLEEMIAKLKTDGDKVTDAYAGVGSVSHITCLMFNAQIGATPTLIPYKGTGPALNDLIGGQVDYMCDQIVNVAEQIKAKKIKAYAIATPERSPALPDVPTTKEAGLPDFQVSAWNALFAPKGTPEAARAKLSGALVKALADPATSKRLADLGAVVPNAEGASPAALAALVKSENDRWIPLLKAAGVTAK